MKNTTDNDLVIILSPTVDENNKWTSEISTYIATDSNNTLDEEDLYSIVGLGKLMVAAIHYLEIDLDFREKVTEYLNEHLSDRYPEDDEYEDTNAETEIEVMDSEGKVIKVDFTPKGNA